MDITIRPITSDEVVTFRTVLSQAFGGDPSEGGEERFVEQVDLSRTYAAFDGDEMIGTAAAFTFEATIPGGVAPMSGLTMVSVRPTHRRRGVLRSMMEAHFADVDARSEPLSSLWASESVIYGRFGYGDAVMRHDVTVDVQRAALRDAGSGDIVRMISADEAADLLPDIYERRRLDRPGMLSRSEPWWRVRKLYDGTETSEGASSKRHAVAFRNGAPVGYVTYRQKSKWDDWLPAGTTNVVELIGDPPAQVALWRFLASIDLFPNISWWNAPVDDPISWLATDVRGVSAKVADSLWVRLMDVARCLEMRSYRAPGRLVLGITDASRPENAGAYELVVDDGRTGSCSPTTDPADVELDVSTLGALYMGGRNPVPMATVGLIKGAPDDIRLLGHLMAWDPPWCPEVF
jgi:predicted acetyltransferase